MLITFDDTDNLIKGLVKYLGTEYHKFFTNLISNELKILELDAYHKTFILGIKLLQKYIL